MENLDDQMYQKIFQFILGNDTEHIFKVNGLITLVNKQFWRTFREYVHAIPLTLVLKFDCPYMDDNGDDNRYRKTIEMRKLTSKIHEFGASVHALHACVFEENKMDFINILQHVNFEQLKELNISLQGPSNHDVYRLFEHCRKLTHVHIHDRTRREINERMFIDKGSLECVSLCTYKLPQPYSIQAILASPKIRSLRLTGLGHKKTVLPSLQSKCLILLRLENVSLDRNSYLDFPLLKAFIAFECIFPCLPWVVVKHKTANVKKTDGMMSDKIYFGMLSTNLPYSYCKSSHNHNASNIWANFSSDCRIVLQGNLYGHL